MEITTNRILGLNVYSLEQGERLGQVRQCVIDTKEKELVALIVANKKFIKDESVICLTDVAGIGSEAVTVDSPAVLRKKADCTHIKDLLKDPPAIEGLSLLKKDGTFLGRADNVCIDSETGKISRLSVQNGLLGNLVKDRSYLPISEIDIIGSDMILVNDNAELREEPNPNGLSRLRAKTKQHLHTKTEQGCGERIMAMSGKDIFHRKKETVFPEIPRDDKEETE